MYLKNKKKSRHFEEGNFYSKKKWVKLVEDGALSNEEAGFMKGYLGEEQNEKNNQILFEENSYEGIF